MHRDMFKIQDGVAIVEKLNCARAAQPDFTLASCHLPNDLVPFLQTEHYNLIYAKLGLNMAQNLQTILYNANREFRCRIRKHLMGNLRINQ